MLLESWIVARLEAKIEQQADTKDRLKKILSLNDQHYCFYQRGQVYLVDQHFEKPVRKLTYSKT